MTATALARPLQVALCVAPLLALQEAGEPSGTEAPGLTRVEAGEAPELPGAGTEFDRRYWRRSLLLDDLEERERRYAELLELAAHPGDARQALEEWALDAFDPSLSWTARLALRELQARAKSAGPTRRLALPQRPPGSALRPAPGGDPLLDQLFDSIFEQHDLPNRFEALLGVDPFGGLSGPLGSSRSSGESLRMSTGPDGVRVELEREEDGQKETKVYEAESLEALLEAHPELGDRLSVSGSLGLGLDARVTLPFFGAQPGLPAAPAIPAAPLRTDILGVYLTEPAESASSGAGLVVERTLPGTIAHSLGLEPGDRLLTINGRALETRADVALALAERGQDEALEVELLDAAGERQDLTWRP